MNQSLFALVAGFGLLGTVSAAHAQVPQPVSPMDRFVDITDAANQRTYEDVARLNKAQYWFLPKPDGGTWSRRGGRDYTELTRLEFVRDIVQTVHGLGTNAVGLAKLRSRQDLQESLLRLIETFRPDLAALGCDPSALRMQVILQATGLATAPPKPIPPPFPDVPRQHWASSSVETLRQAGILVGFPDKKFSTTNP